jgi:hypothetical protein
MKKRLRAKREGNYVVAKKILNLITNLMQGIFAGVSCLGMANVRIPFMGWQNCEARF